MLIIYCEVTKMFKLQYSFDGKLITIESFKNANAAMQYYQQHVNNRDDLK